SSAESGGTSRSALAVELDLFVYALGATGEVVDAVGQRFAVEGEADAVAMTRLQIITTIAHPDGAATLRVLIRQRDGDAYGLRSRIVEIPELAGDARALWAPAFFAAVDPWLAAAVLRQAAAELAGEARVPIVGQRRLPATAGRADDIAATEDPGTIRARRRRLPRQETQVAYRRVLRTLAEGAPAADALRTLELGVGGGGAAVLELGELQWRVLERLAERAGWNALLPVVELHAGLITVYREALRSPLAEHALRLSRRLAKTLARRVEGAERIPASRALSHLAGQLARLGRQGETEELFELALNADPANRKAWLGLAVCHERRGRVDRAVDALEHLLELEPDHAEARLRLALNLERLGQKQSAQRLLASLAVEEASHGVEGWIALLAFQERARSLQQDGRWEAAAGLLERASRRWPEHPGLLIQRALVADRSGDPNAAQRLIERARPVAIESARDRYNRWPESATAMIEPAYRAELLTTLRRALEVTSP
ncbi:MAG: tetratricopeptide repeat protein, partial [Acidobacteriota bacterium]